MINRVLVQFTCAEEVEFLSRFVNELKGRYRDIDVCGLYVRNTDEYLKYNSAMHSDAFYQDFIDVWNNMEDKKEADIREKFNTGFPGCELFCRSGYRDAVALDEMRLFDFLIIAKQDYISHELKILLSSHHKPLIIVPDRPSYSLDRILMADDERLEVNKAFFNFIHLFEDIQEFHALAINIDRENIMDLNVYLNKVDKEIIYDCQQGHLEKLLEMYSDKYDLMIMGDLKHSFLVERISHKPGLRILDNISIPVFIA